MSNKPLAKLRQALTSAADISLPWEIFKEEVASDLALARTAKLAEHPHLPRVLREIARSLLDIPAGQLQVMVALNLEAERFWHGTCFYGANRGDFYFFDDLGVGMSGFIRPGPERQVELTRVAVFAVPVDSRTGAPRAPSARRTDLN